MLRLDVSYSIENIKYNNAPPAHHKSFSNNRDTATSHYAASIYFSFSYLCCCCCCLLLILLFAAAVADDGFCVCTHTFIRSDRERHESAHAYTITLYNFQLVLFGQRRQVSEIYRKHIFQFSLHAQVAFSLWIAVYTNVRRVYSFSYAFL